MPTSEEVRGKSWLANPVGRYQALAFPHRDAEASFSPFVTSMRQFESSVMLEVAERCGLFPGAEGVKEGGRLGFPGLDGADREALARSLGVTLSVLTGHFAGALTRQGQGWRRACLDWEGQSRVAAQLKVQSGALRFLEPGTHAVPPAYALRMPRTDGGWSTFGFTWTKRARGRQLLLVDETSPQGGFVYQPKHPKRPAEMGFPELEDTRGLLKGDTVRRLRDRGGVLVTQCVVPKDLIAGTPLETEADSRACLAALLEESLQHLLADPDLAHVLDAAPAAGGAELLRASDQLMGATLVTLARLNNSLNANLRQARTGELVDPVAQLVDGIRITFLTLARQEKLAALIEKVRARIRALRRAGLGGPQAWIVMELQRAEALLEEQGGDLFEAIASILAQALICADEWLTVQDNSEGDWGAVRQRGAALAQVLEASRAVLVSVGLTQEVLAAYSSDVLFSSRFDKLLAVPGEAPWSRAFSHTGQLMEILAHGRVQVNPAEEGGGIDAYAGEHPLFPLANQVLSRHWGLFHPSHQVPAPEGMMADACLMDAVGHQLDAMNEGRGATPIELAGLQRIARLALEDHRRGAGRGHAPDEDWAGWYALVRQHIEDLGDLPTDAASLKAFLAQLRHPVARNLAQRSATFMGLLGTYFGTIDAEHRSMACILRLMRVNATVKLAQTGASSMPEMVWDPPNPKGVVRLFQVLDAQGRPSGKYGKVFGKPSGTGRMLWRFSRPLEQPKCTLPEEALRASTEKFRLELLHMPVRLPFELDHPEQMTPERHQHLVHVVCEHFCDLPLVHGGHLSHGVLDSGSALARLGIALPSGTLRPMSLPREAASQAAVPARGGGFQVALDLVPLTPEGDGFVRASDGCLHAPERVCFEDVAALASEMDKRVVAASRMMAQDVEAMSEVLRTADAVVDHGAHLLEQGKCGSPLLAMVQGELRFHPPCALLVMPILSERSRGAARDPEACTRAYACMSQLMVALGAAFEGFETQGGLHG